MRVIDADSHVMEPADLWERYLEPRYRDRAIRVVETDGGEQLVIAGQVVLERALAGLGGVGIPKARLFGGGLRYTDGCPPASYDPHERARLLDDWGVDAGVLFPTLGILPVPTDDLDLVSAYARAYNTWQAEFASAVPGRAIPIAMLNLRDRDAAMRELDRCLALGFRGVFLPPEPVDGRRPADPWFDPVWARCAEADVPVCLHVIVRFGGAGVPFEPWLRGRPGPTFTFALGAPGQILPAVASLITDGLFDRFPRLKVVCVEAGCGAAAYLMDRLDEKHASFRDVAPGLELRPGDYLRRNVWWVAEPGERSLGAMLDLVGEDRVLWGSDYPHLDSRPDAADVIRASVAGLSAERRAAVLGGNAARLFGV